MSTNRSLVQDLYDHIWRPRYKKASRFLSDYKLTGLVLETIQAAERRVKQAPPSQQRGMRHLPSQEESKKLIEDFKETFGTCAGKYDCKDILDLLLHLIDDSHYIMATVEGTSSAREISKLRQKASDLLQKAEEEVKPIWDGYKYKDTIGDVYRLYDTVRSSHEKTESICELFEGNGGWVKVKYDLVLLFEQILEIAKIHETLQLDQQKPPLLLHSAFPRDNLLEITKIKKRYAQEEEDRLYLPIEGNHVRYQVEVKYSSKTIQRHIKLYNSEQGLEFCSSNGKSHDGSGHIPSLQAELKPWDNQSIELSRLIFTDKAGKATIIKDGRVIKLPTSSREKSQSTSKGIIVTCDKLRESQCINLCKARGTTHWINSGDARK